MRHARTLLSILLVSGASASANLLSAEPPPATGQAPAGAQEAFDPADLEFFEKQVRPLLATHCHKCHGPDMQKGGLRLDRRAAVLAGGDSGPAVVPGKPDQGRLLDAVNYGELYQMPPSGKLPDESLAILRRWVELGAPWPAETAAAVAANHADFNLEERRRHWAFQPSIPHEPPSVNDGAWPLNDVDRFVLARLEAAALTPAPTADRYTLLRRLSFDLTGLPPTPEELQAYVDDASPEAWSRAVDRLLSSPHFGERWGRHWLDLVRFAESRGHEFDYNIPNAWQYRDYVIRAFNADVPYNQFVTEHLAGDLLEHPRVNPENGANESVLGTGFWYLGDEVHSPVDIRGDQTDRADNQLDVASKTFLALTVACARCHDHKFDPITTRDYYSLAGYLLSTNYRQVCFESIEQNRRTVAALDQLRSQHRPLLLRAVADSANAELANVSAWLLASREALTQPAEATNRESLIASVAAARRLDAARLGEWVAQVDSARADPRSPLHAWALLTGAAAADPQAMATQIAAEAERLRAEAAASALPADARLVLDYGQLSPQDWLQDGLAFGPGPVRPGDVQWSQQPERPIGRLFCRGAAESQPEWDGLQLAPGTETDPSRLNWLQSGRTLRTPTFTLSGKKLYYLVRGSGYAYASVDSHRVNQGPLHGALIREWKAADDWHWVEHDLSAYPGRRVHVEFTPHAPGALKAPESARLAVALIVEHGQAPPLHVAANTLVERMLTRALADVAAANDPALLPEKLAQSYQSALTAAWEDLGADRLAGSADVTALAAWWWERPALYRSPAASERLAAIAAPLLAEQQRLANQLAVTSHTAPAMQEGSGVDETVLLRGNSKTPGQVAPRRYLEVFGGAEQPPPAHGSGRLELAARLTDPAQPLVARVMVNRVWHHLFGRGLVSSVDNFGILGDIPTHPELLDWLADDFMRHGWSIKHAIRLLVTSRAYQMSAQSAGAGPEVDPRNLLLWHMPLRRLEAEAIRDAILTVSGRLDRRVYGPSVGVYLTPFMEGRGRPAGGPLDGDGRRSLYINVRRNFLSPMFLAFDYPIPQTAAGRRNVSNVPAQALILMNSPFVVEQARRWAEQALADGGQTAESRVTRLYLSALGRPARPEELSEALEFLSGQSQRHGRSENDVQSWADLCHVLLNVKEFIYVH